MSHRTSFEVLTNIKPLEAYWDSHHLQSSETSEDSTNGSPSGAGQKQEGTQSTSNGFLPKRRRAVSTASALAPTGQNLPSHHPAHSLREFLDAFGPLVFPIYKMALLRKRILLVTQAPVERACKFGESELKEHSVNVGLHLQCMICH